MGQDLEVLSLFFCSLLSFISTGVLAFYFFCSKQSRTYAFKLVFPIFLYDSLQSLNYICPLVYQLIDENAQVGDSFCKVQAFLKLLATNGMLFSSLIISWVLYSYFIRKKQIKHKNPILHYSRLTIGLPIIIALIPLITSNYGHTEPLENIMCFLIVKNDNQGSYDTTGMILKIILSLVPFVTTLFLEVFFVVRILFECYKNKDQIYLVNVKSLIMYPTILIFSWVWIMFERFYELATNGNQVFWLNEFDLQLGVLNGFLNSIVYGFLSINICNKRQKSEIKQIDQEQEQDQHFYPESHFSSLFSTIIDEDDTPNEF